MRLIIRDRCRNLLIKEIHSKHRNWLTKLNSELQSFLAQSHSDQLLKMMPLKLSNSWKRSKNKQSLKKPTVLDNDLSQRPSKVIFQTIEAQAMKEVDLVSQGVYINVLLPRSSHLTSSSLKLNLKQVQR